MLGSLDYCLYICIGLIIKPKDMTSITLLPADFNTLDKHSKAFENQFTDSDDCPMARALKRVTGDETISNCLSQIFTKDGSFFCKKEFAFDDVQDAADNILEYGKSVFKFGVNVTIQLKKLKN
jgi:hypothetical protein